MASELTRYATETRTIPRSLIRNAPYNPRIIDASAKRKLRESLRKWKVVQDPVWNERNGNLVGGHQRLEALDILEGSVNYNIPVKVVSLDDKEERELNIALNNPALAGVYDAEKLDELIKGGLDLDHMGFEPIDLELLFQQSGYETDTLDKLFTAQGSDLINRAADAVESALDEATEAKRAEEVQEELQGIKERRKDYEAKVAADNETAFYLTVVFNTDAETAKFLQGMRLAPDSKMISGPKLAGMLGIEL